MSAIGLFAVGVLVTLIVAAALALLIYAAILDGRYAAAQRLAAEQQGRSEQTAADSWPCDQTNDQRSIRCRRMLSRPLVTRARSRR